MTSDTWKWQRNPPRVAAFRLIVVCAPQIVSLGPIYNVLQARLHKTVNTTHLDSDLQRLPIARSGPSVLSRPEYDLGLPRAPDLSSRAALD